MEDSIDAKKRQKETKEIYDPQDQIGKKGKNKKRKENWKRKKEVEIPKIRRKKYIKQKDVVMAIWKKGRIIMKELPAIETNKK